MPSNNNNGIQRSISSGTNFNSNQPTQMPNNSQFQQQMVMNNSQMSANPYQSTPNNQQLAGLNFGSLKHPSEFNINYGQGMPHMMNNLSQSGQKAQDHGGFD